MNFGLHREKNIESENCTHAHTNAHMKSNSHFIIISFTVLLYGMRMFYSALAFAPLFPPRSSNSFVLVDPYSALCFLMLFVIYISASRTNRKGKLSLEWWVLCKHIATWHCLNYIRTCRVARLFSMMCNGYFDLCMCLCMCLCMQKMFIYVCEWICHLKWHRCAFNTIVTSFLPFLNESSNIFVCILPFRKIIHR